MEDAVIVDIRLDAPVLDLDGPLQLVEVGGGASTPKARRGCPRLHHNCRVVRKHSQ